MKATPNRITLNKHRMGQYREICNLRFVNCFMIPFSEFTLDNGLRVIVHEDPTVQIAVMNILYDVGSRDERPDKTGFAHLFEHLMFGGSANIPNYDDGNDQIYLTRWHWVHPCGRSHCAR